MTFRLCTVPPVNEQPSAPRNAKQYWRWYDVRDYWGNGIFGILPNHDMPIMRMFRPLYIDISITRRDAAAILRNARKLVNTHTDGTKVPTIRKYGRIGRA